MAAMISEERAREFAAALVATGGNCTAAGKLCGFPSGNSGAHMRMRMVRHPLVQKHLLTAVQQKLQSLTPRAGSHLRWQRRAGWPSTPRFIDPASPTGGTVYSMPRPRHAAELDAASPSCPAEDRQCGIAGTR
jgi:hypothetical protein